MNKPTRCNPMTMNATPGIMTIIATTMMMTRATISRMTTVTMN
ncbi:MAG TPA: hypothetical protein PLQ88_01505 [Blastocatellia bacterium]|nr:hypothetical protein [Blastocatellia bacterium]